VSWTSSAKAASLHRSARTNRITRGASTLTGKGWIELSIAGMGAFI